MIKLVNGNLLDAVEDIIGHQVNCQGAMKSGVAKQLRDKYPEVYKEYKRLLAYGNPISKLGFCQLVSVYDGKLIANLFGQLTYGYVEGVQYTSYAGLKMSLYRLKNDSMGLLDIALPYKIGCMRGGGDWDGVVYPMLEEIFGDTDLLTLYKLEE